MACMECACAPRRSSRPCVLLRQRLELRVALLHLLVELADGSAGHLELDAQQAVELQGVLEALVGGGVLEPSLRVLVRLLQTSD